MRIGVGTIELLSLLPEGSQKAFKMFIFDSVDPALVASLETPGPARDSTGDSRQQFPVCEQSLNGDQPVGAGALRRWRCSTLTPLQFLLTAARWGQMDPLGLALPAVPKYSGDLCRTL